MRWPIPSMLKDGPLVADPTAAHQITLRFVQNSGRIAVGCNCQPAPLEVRWLWEPGEAAEVWRRHMELAA